MKYTKNIHLKLAINGFRHCLSKYVFDKSLQEKTLELEVWEKGVIKVEISHHQKKQVKISIPGYKDLKVTDAFELQVLDKIFNN